MHKLAFRTLSVFLLLVAGPVFAGGVGIVNTVLTDNGDDDGFADSDETVTMRLTLQNTSGIALNDVTLRIVAEDAAVACVTDSVIDVGSLAVDEVRLTDEAFVFTMSGVDRGALGLGPYDELSTAFSVVVSSEPVDQPAYPSRIVLDLDLNATGGGGQTTFFESFESQTLGAFEIENMDAGLHSLEATDGYRCQYSDPDWPQSGSSQLPDAAENCMFGNSELHADATFWGLSGPVFSPLGGRGFGGFHSMFFGIDLGPPDNWTTPLTVMEAARTIDPIHLAWGGATSPQLSFMHQVSLIDWRTASLADGESYDRGVVMAQLADAAGSPVGPWIKIEPFQNVYHAVNAPFIFQCTFDPVDDGTTEDDFFDPTDPSRRYGPSSTCYPELTFTHVGETSNNFDPANVGRVDGPGHQGLWGIGTWIESKFDLGRFRGRSVRLRYVYTAIQGGNEEIDQWEEIFDLDDAPGDDGWWIDDVTVADALTAAATVSADDTDNSSLPDPPGGDGDLDGIADVCDNCAGDDNSDQSDQDVDGLGDVCDSCPDDPDNVDPDGDLVCGVLDNCPDDANPGQADVDGDAYGVPCDCDDSDGSTHPDAWEINDGVDNQCPGDAGYGVTDELTGVTGFFNPADDSEYSWLPQMFAQRYQAVRAETPDFSVGCTLLPVFPTPNTFVSDPMVPTPGGVFFYMAHSVMPNVGSWGQSSSGVERSVPCD